jgi:hypothetical protein
MTTLPQPVATYRSPRARLASTTPAVLRSPDGSRSHGELQVVSLTGGLLFLPKPLDKGAQVKLMFLANKGTILGDAEMLAPIDWGLQPFRFVSLEEADQRRLRAIIQSCLQQNNLEQDWMDKYRARLSYETPPPKRRRFRKILAVLTFTAVCLGSAIYLFGVHLK